MTKEERAMGNGKPPAWIAGVQRWAGVIAMLMIPAITLFQLEMPAWQRAVDDRIEDFVTNNEQHKAYLRSMTLRTLDIDKLATKADLKRLEDRVQRFEVPLLTFLIREGVVE